MISRPLEFTGAKGSATVTALLDSGATVSCVDESLARQLGTPVALPKPWRFGMAAEEQTITVTESVHLDFRLKDLDLFDEFFVVAPLAEPVIIGARTLQTWRIKLDFEADDVIVDPRAARLRLGFGPLRQR